MTAIDRTRLEDSLYALVVETASNLPADVRTAIRAAREREDAGTRSALACLNEARTGICFGAIGAARACLEAAVDYAKTRVQFDKPIGAFQLTQKKLADMAVEVNRGTILAYHLARLKEAGRLQPEHVSMGKLANVNAALWVCREARQILGGAGYSNEYDMQMFFRDSRVGPIGGGTNEIQRNIIAKQMDLG